MCFTKSTNTKTQTNPPHHTSNVYIDHRHPLALDHHQTQPLRCEIVEDLLIGSAPPLNKQTNQKSEVENSTDDGSSHKGEFFNVDMTFQHNFKTHI